MMPNLIWEKCLLQLLLLLCAWLKGVGGGLLLHGFQRLANWASRFSTHLVNTTVEENVASSGGGLACVNCRAILINTILQSNTAQDSTVTKACESQYISAPVSPTSCAAVTAADTMGTSKLPERYIEGAGGAIAALMAGRNSFIIMLCGSRMAHNFADWVGAAMFLDYQESNNLQSTDLPISTQTADGKEPSWHCGLGLATKLFNGFKPPNGISMTQQPKDILKLHNKATLLGGQLIGWNGKLAAQHLPESPIQDHKGPANNSIKQMQYYCINNTIHCFELPKTLEVNLRASNSTSPAASAVALHSGHAVDIRISIVSSIVSGNDATADGSIAQYFNLQYAWRQQRLHKCGACSNTTACMPPMLPLSAVELKQTDPGLYAVGSHCEFLLASTGASSARLEHLILQTRDKPRINSHHNFTFKLVQPHSLLRHVKPMTVEVDVLRCTTGQFELVRLI